MTATTRSTGASERGSGRPPLVASAVPVANATERETRPIPAEGVRDERPTGSQRTPRLSPLPPVRRAPTQIAPILLFFSQTLVDVFAIGGAFVLAYWLRFESDIFRKFVTPDRQTYITMLGVTVATILATFYFSKLYNIRRGASRVDEFYKIAGAVSMGTVLSLATNSLILGDRFVYSRQILLMGWFLTIAFVTTGRMLHGAVVGQLRRRGLDRARVLIVGSGPTAVMVIDRLRYHDTLGYHIVGVVDANGGQMESLLGTRPVPVLGQLDHLLEIVHRYAVDEVLVALTGASDSDLRDLIGLLQDESVSIKVYPDAFQLMTENEVSVGELSGLPLLSVKDVALRGWNRVLKRAFDVVFSLAVLTVTAPVLLIVALAVKLASPGPVFFIQERVGLDNIPFQLVKFRTMRVEGDERSHRAGEPGWTVRNDPRRTRTGTWLRRFSLDELPQFYNVLVGEMSVVGPRPEQPHYVQEFAQRIPQYLRRHREKAGITGWAQVNGLRGDTSIEMRTAADLYYVENWSILFDLKIIARTVVSMLRGKNAY